MLASGKTFSSRIRSKMRFRQLSNRRLTSEILSAAFEVILKVHLTTLLARQKQSSTIPNRVLALRISFPLLSWNVLQVDRSQSGERSVKSHPLTFLSR